MSWTVVAAQEKNGTGWALIRCDDCSRSYNLFLRIGHYLPDCSCEKERDLMGVPAHVRNEDRKTYKLKSKITEQAQKLVELNTKLRNLKTSHQTLAESKKSLQVENDVLRRTFMVLKEKYLKIKGKKKGTTNPKPISSKLVDGAPQVKEKEGGDE